MRRIGLLTSRYRTLTQNRRLGVLLALIAGAVNAGGFLAIGKYTSHLTGFISGVADEIALRQWSAAVDGLTLIAIFAAGAMTTSIVINWARIRKLRSIYAIPILIEGVAITCASIFAGSSYGFSGVEPIRVASFLCFLMGFQNAIVTKISRAEIRTTHMTGVVTDIGILVGRFVINRHESKTEESKIFERLSTLLVVLIGFSIGGVVGALGFSLLGFLFALPLGVALLLIAISQVWRDRFRLFCGR